MQDYSSSNITVKRINEVKGTMSQEQFAKEIGSSQSVVSKVLSGDPPSISVLIGIANRFDVSIDWLLGLSSRKSLKNYSTYDDTNPVTYADITAFLVELLKNKSISFKRVESSDDPDTITINDYFIGDLVFSANSLLKTNPETIDAWLENAIKNYDIPLLEWTNYEDICYKCNIEYRSSLEILNIILESRETQ